MTVITAPNPILRTKTKPVKKITPEIIKIAREMIKLTKGFTDPEGVGLSANQIGRLDRFFIAKLDKGFKIYFNPQILSSSKKNKLFFEGCFSVPNYYGEVKRPFRVKVSFQDEGGKIIHQSLTDTPSFIFQHELDHLNGVLFVDRILEQKGRIFKAVGKDQAGGDIFEEVKLV